MDFERSLNPTEARAECAADGGMYRRTFLKASVAAGGGLLLSFSLPALRRHAEAAGPSTANTFAPNGFIRIGRDGRVTLLMHKAEMGQGVYTSMPMLIAEELEVELGQVHLEAAPPDDTLYADPLIGLQVTGNSTSVRGAWNRSAAPAQPVAPCWCPPRRKPGRWMRGPAAPREAR